MCAEISISEDSSTISYKPDNKVWKKRLLVFHQGYLITGDWKICLGLFWCCMYQLEQMFWETHYFLDPHVLLKEIFKNDLYLVLKFASSNYFSKEKYCLVLAYFLSKSHFFVLNTVKYLEFFSIVFFRIITMTRGKILFSIPIFWIYFFTSFVMTCRLLLFYLNW